MDGVDWWAVFSLNFSSAAKGPFMDSKAKNMYFSSGEGGGGTVACYLLTTN